MSKKLVKTFQIKEFKVQLYDDKGYKGDLVQFEHNEVRLYHPKKDKEVCFVIFQNEDYPSEYTEEYEKYDFRLFFSKDFDFPCKDQFQIDIYLDKNRIVSLDKMIYCPNNYGKSCFFNPEYKYTYNNIPLFEELFAELYKLTKNKIYNSVTFKIYSKE